MCRYMSVSVVAGDLICWCGVVMDGGAGCPPQIFLNLVNVISCILVHFADAYYLKIYSDSFLCMLNEPTYIFFHIFHAVMHI